MNLKRFYFKKYLLFIFILITSIISAQKKFTIVLDAGHGGDRDTGATRKYDDLGVVKEKDITLAVTLKLGRMLEKNKDFKVIYTRKEDVYPTLGERTDLANSSKADLFISVHVNSSAPKVTTTSGTETFVQGPNQNKTNLEVAKRENDVALLDEKDKIRFSSYDPSSPESLIALKINQSKYLQASLTLGSFVEDNYENKNKRLSRGVMQKDLHVLRMNAMPSILTEIGFVNNPEDARYLTSNEGQDEVAASIFDAIIKYKKYLDEKNGIKHTIEKAVEKPKEIPLKNEFRVFLFSNTVRYNEDSPELKGLNNILILKENDLYKYYYGITNMASIRDGNLKTARDAGFRNAYSVGFTPDQASSSYYTIEVVASKEKLNNNSYILQTIKDLEREKKNGIFYYTYGKTNTLEEAIKLKKELEEKGIKDTTIEKKYK